MIDADQQSPGLHRQDSAAVLRVQLGMYFSDLETAFGVASDRGATIDVRRNLAGHAVRIAVVGRRLASAVMPAIAHLPSGAEGEPPGLEIFAWDGSESDVGLPP